MELYRAWQLTVASLQGFNEHWSGTYVLDIAHSDLSKTIMLHQGREGFGES